MKPKTLALAGILLTGLVTGVFDVAFEKATSSTKLWAEVAPMIAGLALIFMWLHYDGLQVGYRRSPLLNVGIVALGIVFIPVYLYRSRVPGQRAPMLLRFVGICLLWVVASAAGYYGALAAT